ncbi:unnamed protein product [Amaranthus hypochondriacus]
MGNFLVSCSACHLMSEKHKVLQVIKMNDGKILEYRTSIKVKDLLIEYPNFYVGLFKEATQPLPLGYKLRIGNVYYLISSSSSTTIKKPNSIILRNNGVVRIKLVLTKKQFHMLFSNHMKVEAFMLEIMKKYGDDSSGFLSTHLKKLEPISEES